MYADDLALVADNPETLQLMLNVVSGYANRWRYTLNADKSVVMVFGEAAVTRRRNRLVRRWWLGGQLLKEADEQHHLGILRSVHSSSVNRTVERCSGCRSSFYALNAVGGRFGRLHPVTAFRLYRSFSLPILLYGSELSTLTKTELGMMERVQRKILRTIMGLPIRCQSDVLDALMGAARVEDLVAFRKLSFVMSTIRLDDSRIARQVLVERVAVSSPRGLIRSIEELLESLYLPPLASLLQSSWSRGTWCSSIQRQLMFRANLRFLDSCNHLPIASSQFKYGAPSRVWSWTATLGEPRLTRLSNFRVRLLAGCSGLEQDASRFRHRRDVRFKTGDPSCKLCGAEVEDPEHFIASCPALEESRLLLLRTASCAVRDQLPSHLSERDLFVDTILGAVWVENYPLQAFCVDFLSSLRVERGRLLEPTCSIR